MISADGLSAFGVDHGISKSLVNGQWVKATKLSGKQRKNVGGYKKAKGVTKEHQKFKATMTDANRQLKNAPAERVHNKGTIFGQPAPAGGISGGTIRLGGKKTGRSVIDINSPAGTTKQRQKAVVAHERAHGAPKRSQYRLHHQIAGNPKKMLREEARADMARGAPGHYTKQGRNQKRILGVPWKVKDKKMVSGYAGSALSGDPSGIRRAYPRLSRKEAQGAIKGYKDTQNKIARAQGTKTYKEPMSAKKQQAIAGGVVGGTGVVGGGAYYANERRKKRA